jgi:tetratricopeptide (TPR) repeat protein
MARLLEPGERHEKWLVLDRHLGSWGVVYVLKELDRESELSRPEIVIGKTIRPEFADDRDRLARFEEECSIWLSLGIHKNIVRLFFVDRLVGQVFAFGEYVPDEGLPNTLRGWLENGLIEQEIALRFGAHIIWGLEHGRSRGLVVHQDLKPENIMVSPDGVGKVTDWGLSRMVPGEVRAPPAAGAIPYAYRGDADASAALGQGSRGYAAPELSQPGRAATAQADLFSLAVILVEMLGGRLPAAGASAADLGSLLGTFEVSQRPALTEQLAACLAAEPAGRPGSAAELGEILAQSFRELVGVDMEQAPLPVLETPSDIGQRAYGLMMLGRIDEGLKLQGEALRMVAAEDDGLEKTPVILMDYKERGLVPVVPEGLIRESEERLGQDPANLDSLDSAIQVNRLAGRLDRAAELCLRRLDITPDDPATRTEFASLLAELGRPQEALAQLDHVIRRHPTAEAWRERAEILERENDLAGAEDAARRAVKLQPDDDSALNALGHMLSRLGRHRRAAKVFRRAIEVKPDSATYWYNLGTCWHALNNAGKASAAFQQAVELRPDFVQAMNTLGVLERESGHEEEAMAWFRRAITTDPSYAKAWFNVGSVYAAASQPDKALDAFHRALEIDPGYALARAAVERLGGPSG